MGGPPDSVFNTYLAPVNLPRITIQFCTQCKWMLRAAYVSQAEELITGYMCYSSFIQRHLNH